MKKSNDIDENIEFTMEKVCEGNLPFLDCIISWSEKREIIAKVYVKPSHTCHYKHFSSNLPPHVKLSTIKTLVRKATLFCSDQTLNKEIYARKTM